MENETIARARLAALGLEPSLVSLTRPGIAPANANRPR